LPIDIRSVFYYLNRRLHSRQAVENSAKHIVISDEILQAFKQRRLVERPVDLYQALRSKGAAIVLKRPESLLLW
jgi:hypothetical protein